MSHRERKPHAGKDATRGAQSALEHVGEALPAAAVGCRWRPSAPLTTVIPPLRQRRGRKFVYFCFSPFHFAVPGSVTPAACQLLSAAFVIFSQQAFFFPSPSFQQRHIDILILTVKMEVGVRFQLASNALHASGI